MSTKISITITSLLILLVVSLSIFLNNSFVFAVTESVSLSASVAGCGDDSIGVGESCDGADLGGASCVSQGYASGTLTCSASCTFNTSSCVSATPVVSNSGGGGVVMLPTAMDVIFTGTTVPLAKIYILKDGQLAATIVALPDGKFTTTIRGVSPGFYNFGVYGEDVKKNRSTLLAFPIYVTNSAPTNIGDIVIKYDEFTVPSKPQTSTGYLIGDLNRDWHVNFLDFSIMKYWYTKYLPPKHIDLNNDKKVDLIDFSIMGYYWTG